MTSVHPMTPIDEVRRLYAFNRWANLRFLDALDGLSDEELGRNMGGSFPSAVGTLVHLLGAEWIWLERWLGRSPDSFPDAAGLSSVAAVRGRWDALWAEQMKFLDLLDDSDLGRPLPYRNMAGHDFVQPLGDLGGHDGSVNLFVHGRNPLFKRRLSLLQFDRLGLGVGTGAQRRPPRRSRRRRYRSAPRREAAARHSVHR